MSAREGASIVPTTPYSLKMNSIALPGSSFAIQMHKKHSSDTCFLPANPQRFRGEHVEIIDFMIQPPILIWLIIIF